MTELRQVAQLRQRDRVNSAILRRWVVLRLNLGWRITFRANIYGPSHGGIVILQLCRWKISVTQTNFVADFIRLKLSFIYKTKKCLLGHLLRHRANVRTPSIARWKARSRLPVRHNRTFLLSVTVQTLQAEICRSQHFSKGVGHFKRKFQTEGGHPPTSVGGRKLEWRPFRVSLVSKHPQWIVWFCHKARAWQTDRQNYDSRDRASCSCGKNVGALCCAVDFHQWLRFIKYCFLFIHNYILCFHVFRMHLLIAKSKLM